MGVEGRPDDTTRRPDPATIANRAQLADALKQLAAGRTSTQINEGLGPYDKIRPATISELQNNKSLPSVGTLTKYLTGCGIPALDHQAWLNARDRAATAGGANPAGQRVENTDPRRHLGVHASIQATPGEDSLPPYIRRDLDESLNAALTAAMRSGGFLLLIGTSSVGKTRSAYEAIKATAPRWWLHQPDTTTDVDTIAAAPGRNAIVWLDEITRFLEQPEPLQPATLRRLTAAGAVVIATIWPDAYTTRTLAGDTGQPHRYASDRALLALATKIDIADYLTPAERHHARTINDPRINQALASTDVGVIQVLAAGPELVRRWKTTTNHPARAVINAALDAYRAGVRAPITGAYLAAAAPGYLTANQRATAGDDWLDHSVDYATTLVLRATGCLNEVAESITRPDGYRPADYLVQTANVERRTTEIPATAWQALVDHHCDDTLRIADNAARRGQYRIAETLFRRALDDGDPGAGHGLAQVMIEQGRAPEAIGLILTAETVNAQDRLVLAGLLADNDYSADAVTVLQSLAEAGNDTALRRLAHLMPPLGRTDDAIALLRQHAPGSKQLTAVLVDLLADNGHIPEATIVIRAYLADGPDPAVAIHMIGILGAHNRVDDLRNLAAIPTEGHTCAHCRHSDVAFHDVMIATTAKAVLYQALARRGELDELRDLAGRGNDTAARWLAEGLVDHNYVDELRQRAAAADKFASLALAYRDGADSVDVDNALNRLRELAAAGDTWAHQEIPYLLGHRGDVEEALTEFHRLAEPYQAIEPLFGSHAYSHDIADLLVHAGRVNDAISWLRQRADNLSWTAVRHLATLVTEHQRTDDLRELAIRGYGIGEECLASVLAEQGRLDELRGESHAGNRYATTKLATLRRQRTRT